MHQSKYDEEIMVIELCSFVMQEINRWLQLWYPLFEDDIFDKRHRPISHLIYTIDPSKHEFDTISSESSFWKDKNMLIDWYSSGF
jgi:hypothetical protein